MRLNPWARAWPRHFWVSLALRFLVLFVLLTLAAVAVLGLIDYQRFISYRHAEIDAERTRVEAAGAVMVSSVDRVLSRLRILADDSTVREFVAARTPENRRALERELLSLARNAGMYSKLRVLAPSGRELIRIDYEDGRARVVAPDGLEDRGGLYYFRDTLRQPLGTPYVSPFELSGRGTDVDRPLDPTLRVAMALPGPDGRAGVVLMLNYRAETLLNDFRSALSGSWGEAMLVNSNGYWLASPEPGDAWGWLLPHNRSFAERFPLAWEYLRDHWAGGVLTANGYFTFLTLAASPEGVVVAGNRVEIFAPPTRFWKVLSWVPPGRYHYQFLEGLGASTTTLAAGGLLLALVSLAIAWLRGVNLLQLQDLRVSEERLGLALGGANEAMWDWDLPRGQIFLSSNWRSMLGYEYAPTREGIDCWQQGVHPDDADAMNAALNDHLEGRSPRFDNRQRMRHRDGHYIWVRIRGKAIRDSSGRPVRMVGVASDITAQVEAEDRLRQAAAVFENTNEAIIVIDAQGRIQAVNSAFTRITGYLPDEAIGETYELLTSGRHPPEFFAEIAEILANTGHWRGEVWERRKNGEIFPVWQNVSVVRAPDGGISQYVCVLTDVSAMKATEQQLDFLAHHDPLTGLPNRLRFQANLEQAILRARRYGRRVAVMFLDLDRFKYINDSLGHALGDELLKAVAERIKLLVRAEDTVARLGGDEFVVVLEELDSPLGATEPAEKIIAAVAQPVVLGGRPISTSTSVGIAVYPDDAASGAELVKAADVAMYQAKQRGRGTFQFFTPELMRVTRERLSLEEGLRRAIAENQLSLCYQPQVSARRGEITGVEALVRWQHPERGELLPDQFVPIAEETGLILPLGEWALRTACRQAVAWRDAGLPLPRVAVNLTVRQLVSPGFLERVQEIVEALPLEAGELQLDLEVTESALQTAQESVRALQRLKALGVGLAIDDFGTGYSSLNSLRKLPIDMLKIDRSFTEDVPGDQSANEICAAIIALGQKMRLRVLAEGVETEAQLRFLREQGCDELQGFLFSKPLAADQVQALLARRILPASRQSTG